MFQMMESIAEARLQKLKADIALRKLQRQQQAQEKKEPQPIHTPVNDADSVTKTNETKRQQQRQAQEGKEPQPVHSPPNDADSVTRTDETKAQRQKKKEKHSAKKLKAKLNDSETVKAKSTDDGDDEGESSEGKRGEERREKKQKKGRKQNTDSQEKSQSDDSGNDSAEDDAVNVEPDPNVIGGFSILGNFTHEPIKPVKRKLPDWLANPTIIGGSLKKWKVESCDKEDEVVMRILDEDVKRNLHDNGITSFFPVQRQFIPDLWQDLKFSIMGGRYGLRPRDFCVSAPTGSGKTLAYTLPIIQCLKQRLAAHVWAVVVLPVRDLAEQVYSVFCQYCTGTPLKVGLVVGKTPFSVEQESLVMKRYPGVYHSLVDILVATPGRLVDHINSTPGFDLSHLRFLVIDEADRMMEDIKHDWLSAVETAAYTPAPLAFRPLSRSPPGPLTIESAKCSQLPLQKLLFSATLSHNPEKLERLNLFMPRLMTSVISQPPAPSGQLMHHDQADDQQNQQAEGNTEVVDGGFVGKYTTPEGLTEYLVECEVAEKPLMVLHFLHTLQFRSVLCFTNSVETTHRLCLLMKLYGGLKVKEFSSRLPGERRKKILRQFSKGNIDLLVCSDVMARGMDVDNVKYVISYDKPPFLRTYIHRVGRTARAGRAGTAISLLEKKEFFHFKKMMREAGKWGRIREMKLSRGALKPLVEPFQAALAQLPDIIKEEKKQPKR